VLPREHVHVQEGSCAECEELRGFHHGETTVARRHSWPTRLVARALNELSRGGSYADVSRQALRAAERIAQRHEELVRAGLTEAQADAVVDAEEDAADRGLPAPAVESVLTGEDAANEEAGDTASEEAVREDRARYRRRRRPPRAADDADDAEGDPRQARGKNPRSAESHDVWHIAADWTEAFAPVLFEPVEQQLRERTRAERVRLDALREADKVLDGPQVLLLDDVPVYGRDRGGSGRSRRDDGFFLLMAAEVKWGAPSDHPAECRSRRLRLRLVRAMPKSNAAASRLLLDELGYHPDFVVADTGTGIGRAVAGHFDPARTVFVPSRHVAAAVKTGLADTRGALVPVPGGGKEPLPELRTHLAELARDGAIRSAGVARRP
jgi:hypothetical protein